MYGIFQYLISAERDEEATFFMRSQAICNIIVSMIALSAENPMDTLITEVGRPGLGRQLVISVTKVEHLDLLLNQMKLKAILLYNDFLEEGFN